MAVQKHGILAAMVVLLFAIEMASSQLAPAPASAIPNVDSPEAPPNLSAAKELFIQKSLNYVTEECAKSIGRIIFTVTEKDRYSEYPSRECCLKVLSRYPYGRLVESIISSPEFKGNKDQIRQNTQDVPKCGFMFGGGK